MADMGSAVADAADEPRLRAKSQAEVASPADEQSRADEPQFWVRRRAIPRRSGGRWRRAAVAGPKHDMMIAMVAV